MTERKHKISLEMSYEEILSQLRDLIQDRESFVTENSKDADFCEPYIRDINALEVAVSVLEDFYARCEGQPMTYNKLKAYPDAEKNQQHEVDEFIKSIDDSQTREMFDLRFRKRLKYFQIAAKLGGGMTAGCVRMRIARYMDSKSKQ